MGVMCGEAVVLYTTEYREGGREIERCARRLARDLNTQGDFTNVVCRATESKREFRAFWDQFGSEGRRVREFHFVGHSGMYGVMFGTRQWPEQFSPAEWQSVHIPFAKGARAYFHACRTARWFAPFFAQTFGVRTFGNFYYTTFSADAERFLPPWLSRSTGNLFCISTVGKKSHGLLGSLRKYLLRAPAIPMTVFDPTSEADDRSYERVARMYARAFPSIRSCRPKEWAWLQGRLARYAFKPVVLDLGCGNGALLRDLDPMIARGIGVDTSANMVALAEEASAGRPHLQFEHVSAPTLPVEDGSVDVVVSLLSMRYLDWDPILKEVRRVLRPDGRLLVIDMAASPLRLRELPRLLAGRIRTWRMQRRNPEVASALNELVRSEEWQQMVRYNPMRAEHEYLWYFRSRFPEMTYSVLDVGREAKVYAFDCGPISTAQLRPQTYP